MKIKCQSFVVDADVARAAGKSEHPVSKGARELLQAILSSDARAVFCPKMIEEWKNHRSVFSTKWQSSMTAKRKIDKIAPDTSVSEIIEHARVTDAQKEIAKKDAHVVDAALTIKSIIASNDSAARAVFKILGKTSGNLGELIWVSPTLECDRLIDLISSSGYVPSEWILRSD